VADPFSDLGALRAQCARHVCRRVVQDGPDLVQAEAELTVDDDAVQAFQVAGGVEPVSGGRAQRRPRQAGLVPVVQRADCHAQSRRDLADGQAVGVGGIRHAPHCRRGRRPVG